MMEAIGQSFLGVNRYITQIKITQIIAMAHIIKILSCCLVSSPLRKDQVATKRAVTIPISAIAKPILVNDRSLFIELFIAATLSDIDCSKFRAFSSIFSPSSTDNHTTIPPIFKRERADLHHSKNSADFSTSGKQQKGATLLPFKTYPLAFQERGQGVR